MMTAGDIALFIAALAFAWDIVYYHRTAHWRRSGEGNFIMAWCGGFEALLGYLAYAVMTRSRLAPQIPFAQQTIRLVVFLWLIMMAVWLFVLIFRAQRAPLRPNELANERPPFEMNHKRSPDG